MVLMSLQAKTFYGPSAADPWALFANRSRGSSMKYHFEANYVL